MRDDAWEGGSGWRVATPTARRESQLAQSKSVFVACGSHGVGGLVKDPAHGFVGGKASAPPLWWLINHKGGC